MKRLLTCLLLISVVALSGCHASRVARPALAALQVSDLVTGTGAGAKRGDSLTVHYVAWLSDSTRLDSSYDRGQPFRFVLGVGQVIRGWELGMPGARVGGIRRLVIPPYLAYGVTGVPPIIPPNATLVFEVELLGVRSP